MKYYEKRSNKFLLYYAVFTSLILNSAYKQKKTNNEKKYANLVELLAKRSNNINEI